MKEIENKVIATTIDAIGGELSLLSGNDIGIAAKSNGKIITPNLNIDIIKEYEPNNETGWIWNGK